MPERKDKGEVDEVCGMLRVALHCKLIIQWFVSPWVGCSSNLGSFEGEKLPGLNSQVVGTPAKTKTVFPYQVSVSCLTPPCFCGYKDIGVIVAYEMLDISCL